jgi:type III restriction enzyme
VIVETKGQEDLDVPPKMARLRQWCEDVNKTQSQVQYDFVFVDDAGFEKYSPKTFADVLNGFRKYKET